MSAPSSNTPTSSDDNNSSLLERWNASVRLVESSPVDAVQKLQQLQNDIDMIGLFSTNETLDDVGSKSIPLLSVDYQLAMAHLNIAVPPSQIQQRHVHLTVAMKLFSSFLHALEQYEVLTKEQIKDYHELSELQQQNDNDNDNADNSIMMKNTNYSRDAKIARYRAKQTITEEITKLQALQSRRGRLDIRDTEELDGHDEESLERTLQIQMLQLYVVRAIEEWHQVIREVPMVKLMMQRQGPQDASNNRPPPPPSGKPLQLTHITKDASTGHLSIQKEEIKSKIFRPSWNQPTMTLEELGEIEVAQAKEREQRQLMAEAQAKQQPRRYQQLAQDGLEDNADLVDASAKKDREWDDFKDANPRGSGNKMGDRGDRNF